MVVRRFNEADIDFEAIDVDLAKLAPPKLSLKDVLDRLRESSCSSNGPRA